jgi:hypothetical protein
MVGLGNGGSVRTSIVVGETGERPDDAGLAQPESRHATAARAAGSAAACVRMRL